MSTTYDIGRLTFGQRLKSCSHVLVGLIDGVEEVQIEELPGGARAITIFQVKVIKPEFGPGLPDRITVRVVGGTSGDVTTPWTAAVANGQQMLLVLARDYGTRPNQFVPCFGAVSAVSREGSIEVDAATAGEVRTLAGAPPGTRITPRLIGAAAKAATRTTPAPKGRVQTVELDRIAGFPTDVPLREVPPIPSDAKQVHKPARKKGNPGGRRRS